MTARQFVLRFLDEGNVAAAQDFTNLGLVPVINEVAAEGPLLDETLALAFFMAFCKSASALGMPAHQLFERFLTHV